MGVCPFVSVIIPTYQDWDRLIVCLKALARQKYPIEKFEVLVVNNDPNDKVALNVPLRNIRMVDEQSPGSYVARNAGIENARGEVLAFTDSDCVPRDDWLLVAVSELIDSDADVLAGKVDVYCAANTSWAAWKYESVVAFKHYRARGSGVTANLVTWRKCIEDVGMFPEHAYSGGDSEWCRAAKVLGKSIQKSEAQVWHPSRTSLAWIVNRNRRVIGGRLARSQSKAEAILILLSYLLPPVSAIRIWRASGATRSDCCVAFLIRYWIKLLCVQEVVKHLVRNTSKVR